MRKALKTVRANSDFVIAALHDGLEYSDVPPARTRARFRFLAENGADIVFGHHPHVLQGLEWHEDVPIIYSLGDLLNHCSLPAVRQRILSRIDMARFAPNEVLRNNNKFRHGAVLTIRVSGRNKTIQWHPFRQDGDLRPQLSSGNVKSEDLARIADLSNALADDNDSRHALANSVVEKARFETLDNISLQELCKLAVKPKWRYISRGIKLLRRRLGARQHLLAEHKATKTS
jgi:hypothetical protein